MNLLYNLNPILFDKYASMKAYTFTIGDKSHAVKIDTERQDVVADCICNIKLLYTFRKKKRSVFLCVLI